MIKKGVLLAIIVCISQLGFSQAVKKIKVTDLEKTIAASTEPMVINFWATFCLPCIEEIPFFEKLTARYKADGVSLLLVSLDLKDDYEKIRPFATKRKFTAPLVWLDESNADYFMPRIDSAWSGSIPATLFINTRSGYRKFLEKEFSESELEKEFLSLLGKH